MAAEMGNGPPAEPYEAPAIAWEEAFEPLAATSCLFVDAQELNCGAQSMGP